MTERIALDMDGVIADTYQRFFELDEKDFGKRKNYSEAIGKTEDEAFPQVRKYLHEPGFFSNLPVIKDSREIVEALYHRYDLFIVSAATEFPQSLIEKQAWLNEHFPFISWQKMVFCGSKQIIQADIMIDDHFKNLNHFPGRLTILYSQPHNMMADAGRHTRVQHWQEIGRLLL